MRWREVTPRSPCPVCGKGSWCSVREDDAVVCCRRVSEGGTANLDRAGVPYYLHRVRGGDPVRLADALDRWFRFTLPARQAAAVEVRDAVYRALLEDLPLVARHREDLHRRGMPGPEVARRGYRSLPPGGRPWSREDLARRLAERFGSEVLAAVPGFVQRESKRDRHYWTIAGPAGLLIPVRNLEGRIIALKVRRDGDGDGPRYVVLSSKRQGGPGPGSPAHVPLEPPGGRDPDRVRLTEGELKADVATARDPGRILTVSAPGATAWRVALPILEALRPRTVRLALDADAGTNPNVGRALREALAALESRRFIVEVERW